MSDMTRVWFDHQIFSVQRYGGYTRYFLCLARALRAEGKIDVSILAPAYVSELPLRGDPLHPISFKLARPKAGVRFRPKAIAPLFRLIAEIGRPDVIHETHHILGGWQVPKSARIVCTCHDMIPERYSNGSMASQVAIDHKRRALERASRIICVSKSTQSDLAHFYPDLAKRSVVVHHGVTRYEAPELPDAGVPTNFLLFVGARNGYKNFHRLLQAIASSPELPSAFHLVCFGGGKLNAREVALVHELRLRPDRIHCIEGDDDLLTSCYRQAGALVFPSEYEGFGMPLTEAMVQGCPVICSDIPSFREVCEGAAYYFDPADVGEIRDAISAVLLSDTTRQRLTQLGNARARAFSWQRCALETTAVYVS
jgi:glycosyltransferase involved in cell wall biosynthesis